jgi:transcriptional regulator NrdR family protein
MDEELSQGLKEIIAKVVRQEIEAMIPKIKSELRADFKRELDQKLNSQDMLQVLKKMNRNS